MKKIILFTTFIILFTACDSKREVIIDKDLFEKVATLKVLSVACEKVDQKNEIQLTVSMENEIPKYDYKTQVYFVLNGDSIIDNYWIESKIDISDNLFKLIINEENLEKKSHFKFNNDSILLVDHKVDWEHFSLDSFALALVRIFPKDFVYLRKTEDHILVLNKFVEFRYVDQRIIEKRQDTLYKLRDDLKDSEFFRFYEIITKGIKVDF